MNEIVLIESRAARSEAIGRTDVLDKVKALATLPDDLHMTTELVASYFEVSTGAIDSVVRRSRGELTENGLRVVRGEELRNLRTDLQDEDLFGTANAITLFTRRTVLNVAMLLVDSEVARDVRRALLDRYEQPDTSDTSGAASPDLLKLAHVAKARLEALSVASRDRLVDPKNVEWTARAILRQMDPTLGPPRPERSGKPEPAPDVVEPDTLPDDVVAFVRDNPGATTNAICRALSRNKNRTIAVIREAVRTGQLTVVAGPHRAHLHHVADGPLGVVAGNGGAS